MAEQIIKIPENFDFYNFNEFSSNIKKIEVDNGLKQGKKNSLVFEISETRYLSAIGVLMLVQTADRFSKFGWDCYVMCPKKQESNPWKKLVILGALKESIQQFIEAAFVVPIQRIYNYDHFTESINKKIMPLIKKYYNPPESVLKAITWILNETIDNAMCHGYDYKSGGIDLSVPVYVCAYLYQECIDIAILDLGQGIKKSFLRSGNQKYAKIKNEEALKLSVIKGESGRKGGGTGIGLWGCSEIAKQSDGEFIILSGNQWLHLTEKTLETQSCLYFKGTIVQLSIPKDVNIDFYKVLHGEIDITPSDFDWIRGDVE